MVNQADETIKSVVLGVGKLMMDLDALNALPQDEKTRLNTLASQVVGLRDTGGFNVSVVVDRDDVKRLRRDLASAISAEKFVSGFMTAIKLLSAVGAI